MWVEFGEGSSWKAESSDNGDKVEARRQCLKQRGAETKEHRRRR